MAYSSKYSFELWTKNGQLVADLGGRAMNREIILSRNQPEDISFDLDLNDFENYCRSLQIDPKQVLIVKSMEVRVKRLGTYLVGGQLVYKTTKLSADTLSVTCKAKGFLALFNKRYTGRFNSGNVSEVYTAANGTAKNRSDLAWTLINQSQALTNGNFGITRGLIGGPTTLYDKTYSRTNIMNALMDITNLQTDPIDIEFTYDKVFNTYKSIGSNRTDIVFEYPGNILSAEIPDDGTDLWNEVIGLGAGAADGTQPTYFAVDSASQANFQLQQDILQSNATDNSNSGLTDKSEAMKAAKANPIKIPAITVNGNVAPYVTDYKIGDRVAVKINDHPLVDDINGMYRIEKITITIDNDDNEQITLQVSA